MTKENHFLNLQVMQSFDESCLPTLDTCTLGALELFIKEGIPKMKLANFKRPLVLGSGNAIVAGHIIFADSDAIFADESEYETRAKNLQKLVDGAILLSASGGKHAVVLAKKLKAAKIDTQLITCNKEPPAAQDLEDKNITITQKNPEPYTYNTSTYMGWILAKTKEDPQEIYNFIHEKIKVILDKQDFSKYKGFLLITPNEFSSVNQLFEVKFIELFARRIARDVKTVDQAKHAITVVPYEKELNITFGVENFDFQGDQLQIPLPEKCGPATLMAIAYYVIGHIQKAHPAYFIENIANYVERESKKSFGKGSINVIVN